MDTKKFNAMAGKVLNRHNRKTKIIFILFSFVSRRKIKKKDYHTMSGTRLKQTF